MNFDFDIHSSNGIQQIDIKGNLIEKNQAEGLLGEIDNLIELDTNRFIINMQEFQYMNSTGLNVLINILTKARKSGGEAVICNMPDKIKELMLITKLNAVFTTADSLDMALQQFN